MAEKEKQAAAAAEDNGAAEAEEDRGPARRNDPELLVLGQILRKFDELEDAAAQGRVMDYLYSRFVSDQKRSFTVECGAVTPAA